MKTFSSLFIVLWMSMTLAASSKCERLTMYERTNLLHHFTQDLTTHSWKTSLLGRAATLYFKDDGILLAVPATPGKVESYIWSLTSSYCNTAVLTIVNAQSEQSFSLSPTCDGMSALDADCQISMLFGMEERLPEAQLAFLRDQLRGTWHYHGPKARKGHPSQFALALNGDGSFVLKTAPDMYHSAQEGVWHLSPDGQFLILFSHVYIGEHKRYIAEAISLKSADYEDLVIDARCLPRALQDFSGKQTLFLSKAA